jgi:ribosomal protein S12 methylthiotransferase
LAELLEKLCKVEGIEWIRLHYAYPTDFPQNVIEVMAREPKICKYLDIPLQHLSDNQLELMHRRHTKAEALFLIERLRTAIPDIAIRSTFISGFPTETEEDFEGMKAFIQQAKLTNCGFFAYSREPYTGAYKMKPQVHHKTKGRRVRALYAVQQEISKQLLSKYVGKELEIICDGIDYEKNCFVGRAYFQAPDIDGKVYFNAAEAMQGERYKVQILSCDSYDLYGKTEDYSL